MATQGRRAADPLSDSPPARPNVDRLMAEPFAFDFFQAVRLLHALEPGREPVGRGGPPSAEVVRFRSYASLSFPPSSIRELSPAQGPGRPAVMTQAFLGLTGPNGVLPRHYTEMLIRLDRELKVDEKHALRDWLDLFNHRFTSLFYRAWEKYRAFLAIEADRDDLPDAEPEPFTLALLSFIGLGTPALRNRLVVRGLPLVEEAPTTAKAGPPRRPRVEDASLVRYSGLLAHRPRSAIGLRAILLDYFGLGVEVIQFRGRWLNLELSSQSRLVEGPSARRLGVDAVVGERAWDVQGLFRVRLGPLSLGQFRAFLPDRSRASGGAAFLLAHLVRLYAGPEFDFDLQLVLKGAEVPRCRLPEGSDEGPILGWDCWITEGPLGLDADDAVFSGDDLG